MNSTRSGSAGSAKRNFQITRRIITGEARVLSGTSPAKLLWNPLRIDGVHGFDHQGRKVVFEEKRDWVLDQGAIRRTEISRIPDFAEYTYSTATPCSGSTFDAACLKWTVKRVLMGRSPWLERDQFLFSAPRNPPEILGYTVYVDYSAETPDQPIAPLADRGFSRLLCSGDSIGAGAHTIAEHFYDDPSESWPGLLDKFFGRQANALNLSHGGATIEEIAEIFWRNCTPSSGDIVLLAPGMNDHVKGPRNLGSFRAKVAEMVNQCLAHGAGVVLVGFFQQNPLWCEERPSDTRAYNEALAEIALRLAVPFVDIAAAFRIACPQDAHIHLTGDFMHHPNAYGQRIYFSCILPFLIETAIRPSQIPLFVELPAVDKITHQQT